MTPTITTAGVGIDVKNTYRLTRPGGRTEDIDADAILVTKKRVLEFRCVDKTVGGMSSTRILQPHRWEEIKLLSSTPEKN